MATKKYKLYATESGWDNKHVSLMAHLGIPAGNNLRYAIKTTVQNPDSSDHGKFIKPVVTTGEWKCDDQFSSGVVNWNNDWDNLPGG